MNDNRPDPDLLLAQVRASEARAHRGRLTVFFGANAGVGKTYAMLEAAQRRRAEGVDVVAGYVELHGRAETERLLVGLEQLPPLAMSFGNTKRREFDLDAALSGAGRACCWSTSSPTPTSAAVTRRRATRSAGRISRNCSMPASMSTRRSMCSIWNP